MMHPTTPSHQNSRQKRKPLASAAQLLFTHRDPINVRTIDISTGGIGILTSENLPIGTNCTLSIRMPTGQTLKTQAQVTYSILRGKGGFRIGLRFLSIDPIAVSVISKFMME